jgi:ribosome recycling factor
MEDVKNDAKERMKKSVLSLQDDFNTIRTGRASASLFDKVRVEYYGTPTPLNQLATISIPEARLVVIQPWDPTVLGEIEKAIQKSELSLNPNNDGKVIRINIPPLTEERRKEYVKVAKNMAEQARIAVRNIRRDANEHLKKRQKDGDITEDQEKRAMDKIQEMTDKNIEKIDQLLEEKENEIMEI